MNKKARVGLLNFQYSKDNYGAVLQAAALERLVKKRVENVEHIDYRPQRNRIRLLLSAIVKRLLNKNSRNDSNNALSSQGFESFRVKFISRTPIIFNKKKFRVESANYDAIIVGSDQVWRPTMGGDPLVFFLNYCNP
ncbi:polysaccharide pyruvyl transferase family protein, partial [Idiomarina sp. UBA3162]|uniref:polysaccharide pyruvyl transferase family protein n=1 Tax=Idiomarina sp. UBA3162 TaxID=1946641 RepID=UPI0025B8A1BC